MATGTQKQLLSDLSERIRTIEGTVRPVHVSPISLGIPEIEDWLPDGRLAPGSLVELLSSADGAGAWTLALFLARNASGLGKILVVVDHQACFYPPAAAGLGVDLDRLIVIRPRTLTDAALAVDQSLRTPAVGAVLGWYDRLTPPAFRRLQLAAENGGGLGLLLRPVSAQRAPSFAALRLLLMPLVASTPLRQVRLDVLRCRGGRQGQSLIVEIDDATGHVRVPAVVAAAAPAARPARA